MAVIGIIVFCGGIICAASWLLNRPERPKDPGRGPGAGTVSEGMEQEPWEKRKKKLKRQWA